MSEPILVVQFRGEETAGAQTLRAYGSLRQLMRWRNAACERRMTPWYILCLSGYHCIEARVLKPAMFSMCRVIRWRID
jgi:hypothetical protein